MNAQTKRIVERIETLGKISNETECLSRFFGTTAHKEAREVIKTWMEEEGLEAEIDTIGNVRGVLYSEASNAKHLVVGSHYDTVFQAGKYDGPLGILLGLEMVHIVQKNDIKLPFHFNVVAFTDEEGGRFNTTYLGSSVLAGNFNSKWLDCRDDNDKTMQEVIEEMGGHCKSINKDKIPQKDWLAYFEIHIEQGPVLCKEDLPVCVVNTIAAQTRIEMKWLGKSGHAGTSPMDMRKDAFCAAAEFALAVETLGQEHSDKLVATVGKVNVKPNTSNVIPGYVYCTLDIRSQDDYILEKAVEALHKAAELIAEKRALTLNWKIVQTNPSVVCDENITRLLKESVDGSNVERCLEIPSGAGHDGVMISRVAPVSMLFVRCEEGISHHPKEYAAPMDIAAALEVCRHFIFKLNDFYKKN